MNSKALALGALLPIIACGQNILINPSFEFHSFQNHRSGQAASYLAQSAAFWHYDDFGDMTVEREAHVPADRRPAHSVHNIVTVRPGKHVAQVIPLPEGGLAHGDRLSLGVSGWQSQDGAATAKVELLKIDSEDGTWVPSDFGMRDSRTFPRHARGELVVAKTYQASADKAGFFSIRLDEVLLDGHFTVGNDSHSEDMNTVAVRVSLENSSDKGEVRFWAPALVRGQLPESFGLIPSCRKMEPVFASLPKTMQKLWKGESLHILLMGSSIDRGSANPPLYCYNEDPNSPDFKKPLSNWIFEADKIGHPEYDGYFGWWQHYYSYCGRLRLELMRKFDLPISKICMNVMACDGSCVAEAMSGLEAYCTLSRPPSENVNGHKNGRTWQELYPELFTRPQGPGPDLVIFGSGANEKTDTPDEGAVFEATIRWIQQRYPDAEFLFCMFQNMGAYTPNPGDLQAIALRYQIPFMDFGKLGDDLTRWCNPRTLVPVDGHPQAAGHFFWFHEIEKAFEAWDPIPAGRAQLRLPSRIYGTTVGWEGEITTYAGDSPRIVNGTAAILDDTAFNLWATGNDKNRPNAFVDGVKVGTVRHVPGYDMRNSAFRHGRLALGDRHVLEIAGDNAGITALDMKTVNGRNFFPVSSAFWTRPSAPVPFQSRWGAPYGSETLVLEAGAQASITLLATDLSIAYADEKDAGTMAVEVDGAEAWRTSTAVPFKMQDGTEVFMENRRAVLRLPYGLHAVTVKAEGAPVKLLGIFAYDTRPNTDAQRIVNGIAVPGEQVKFMPPFKATPLIHAFGGLKLEEASRDHAVFSGTAGSFTAIGE